MAKKINVSEKIEYSDISKEEFQEFVDVLLVRDPAAYKEESADGFLDLYSYWIKTGAKHMRTKLRQNKERIEAEKELKKL